MRASLPLSIAIVAVFGGGCAEPLETGEWGTFRYFADVPGQAPLRLLPPVSDRAGNVYVLHGAPDRAEARVWVGDGDGDGWSGGCDAHKGDSSGVHGWAGTVEDAAWYWSGTALVEVNGRTGGCHTVLDNDPSSNAELLFEAVIPWVRDTPSEVTLPALVRAPADPRPFQIVVDLKLGRYSGASEFKPYDATDVRVAGVGAADGAGFLLVGFTDGSGQSRVEGRFLDADADTTATAPITGLGYLARDSVRGYLQADDDGLVAGLLEDGDLVVFDRQDGKRRSVSGMDPVGVHRWKGRLWLVGTDGGRPVIAKIDRTGAGDPVRWRASEKAAEELGASIEVLDERSDPTTSLRWDDPHSAIGELPFVHAHRPGAYGDGSTGWVVAGPSFETGIEGMTSAAFSPVGISYP